MTTDHKSKCTAYKPIKHTQIFTWKFILLITTKPSSQTITTLKLKTFQQVPLFHCHILTTLFVPFTQQGFSPTTSMLPTSISFNFEERFSFATSDASNLTFMSSKFSFSRSNFWVCSLMDSLQDFSEWRWEIPRIRMGAKTFGGWYDGLKFLSWGCYRFVKDILSSSYILTVLHTVSWVWASHHETSAIWIHPTSFNNIDSKQSPYFKS